MLFRSVRVPKRDQKQWEVDTMRAGQSSERQVLRGNSPESLDTIWRDVLALANMGGGVVIVGIEEQGAGVVGVPHPEQASELLRRQVQEQIVPQPYITMELMNYEGRDLIRMEVRAPETPPYMSRDGVLYVRRGNEPLPAKRLLSARLASVRTTTPISPAL